jgi:hypothetical protein
LCARDALAVAVVLSRKSRQPLLVAVAAATLLSSVVGVLAFCAGSRLVEPVGWLAFSGVVTVGVDKGR